MDRLGNPALPDVGLGEEIHFSDHGFCSKFVLMVNRAKPIGEEHSNVWYRVYKRLEEPRYYHEVRLSNEKKWHAQQDCPNAT